MNNDKCRIIIEFDDGTVAIWGEVDEEQAEHLIVGSFGDPDTLHC